MKKTYILLLITFLSQNIVFAQATRTWVSGVGDDANPCSRTAPCKTFAGAISKTAAGGEISVLDNGSFGAVTITKALTINGDGNLAGILHSATNGIIVNAGVNDIVVIRNVSLNGAGTTLGTNGIRFLAGGQLHVENCSISGFTTRGIDVTKTAKGILTVENTTINGPATNATGIYITTTTDSVETSLKNVRISNVGIGLHADTKAYVNVMDSNISQNVLAVKAENTGSVNIESSLISNNGVGVLATTATSIIRLSNASIFNNSIYGIGDGFGKVISFGNNSVAGNAANKPMQTIAKQ